MTTISMARETTRNFGHGTKPGLMGKIKGYLVRTQAVRQLNQLDDRMLSDIGLSRGEINSSVWGR